ncbi:Protein MAIN-LIKE 2 [Linum perenne]
MSRYGWAEPLVDRTPEAVRPQPSDCSLLWGENKHRASLVWRDPQACKALKLRQRSSALTFHQQYETFLRECGLYSVVSLLGQTPCKELVTALLERWRPKTNTFHLLQGEETITLEDVEVLTGLPTRGRPVSEGYDDRVADVICQELLGTVLLADRSGDLIPVHLLRLLSESAVAGSFSWGSAVLAWLYKAMGRATFFTGASQKGTGDIGGFTLLVQLWALEIFSYIADRYIVGGDPPADDSYPRGMRWMPIVHRHQHLVSMKLEEICYALDRSTKFVVRILLRLSLIYLIFLIGHKNVLVIFSLLNF